MAENVSQGQVFNMLFLLLGCKHMPSLDCVTCDDQLNLPLDQHHSSTDQILDLLYGHRDEVIGKHGRATHIVAITTIRFPDPTSP